MLSRVPDGAVGGIDCGGLPCGFDHIPKAFSLAREISRSLTPNQICLSVTGLKR